MHIKNIFLALFEYRMLTVYEDILMESNFSTYVSHLVITGNITNPVEFE